MGERVDRTGNSRVPGTVGYGEDWESLAAKFESRTFEEAHREVLHLFLERPGRVLDVGAGSGRDAAALRRSGHTVLAVEPTAELRAYGQRRHAAHDIEWIDDHLPELINVRRRLQRYDLILLAAVWMHLERPERPQAMRHLASLLAPQGRMIMSVRHGPVPTGRRMFEVPDEETLELAAANGLTTIHQSRHPDHRPDHHNVHWSQMALRRP